MNTHYKFLSALIGATSLTALTTTTPVVAQTQVSEQSEEIEEVVVKGFRDSLTAARNIKRDAAGQQDSIIAEDIADFPDLNIAESLQRISGVTITRDNGEGRQIALRGLGPEFTRTQINGIEALATLSSSWDNRGSSSRTRNFDFNIFASELFNRVDVYKSYEASLDEGGIAGTVNLHTPQPFDYKGFKGTLIGRGAYNDMVDNVQPRVAGLVSDTWGDFGALVSVAYTESDNVETGHRDWGWRTFSPSNFGSGVTAAQQQQIESGSLIGPRVATYAGIRREQQRLGITTSLQWQPSERIDVSLDGLFANYDTVDREYQLANQGLGNLTGLETDGNNSVLFASFSEANIRSESKYVEATTEFYQLALNGEFQVNDRLTLDGTISTSDSEFSQPVFDKIFLQALGHDFSYDYRGARRVPNNNWDFDINNAANWNVHRADLREDLIGNEYNTYELNSTYELDFSQSVSFGVQFKDYTSSGYQRRDDIRNLNDDGLVFALSTTEIEMAQPFAVADVNSTFANILARDYTGRISGQPFNRNLGPEANAIGSVFDLTEETLAMYGQYEFGFDRIRGNVGLRWLTTDVESRGESLVSTDIDGDGSLENRFVPVTIKNDYSEFLPAFNLVFDASDELLFRLSGSRNISRPNLSDLRAAARINISGNSVNNGNPGLEPFIASSFETSAEYYFGETNYISVAAFTKDLQSFIVPETREVSFAETGLPDILLTEDRVGQPFSITQPVNGEGGTIQGIEIAGQYEFLPGLGVIANYTYADGKTEYSINGETVKGPLLGLSKSSYNLTGYYETDQWGLRASVAHREQYYTNTNNNNIFLGINDTAFVDASAFVNVTSNIRVTLEGINLTDEPLDEFANPNANRPQVFTRSGRTILLGVAIEL